MPVSRQLKAATQLGRNSVDEADAWAPDRAVKPTAQILVVPDNRSLAAGARLAAGHPDRSERVGTS